MNHNANRTDNQAALADFDLLNHVDDLGAEAGSPNGVDALGAALRAAPPKATDDYAAVPIELKKLPQWLAWKIVPDANGKPQKVPVRADGRGAASSTNSRTWSAFPVAVAAFQKKEGGLDGIGFTFTKDDPYVGIDFDDCLSPDGAVEAWAAEWLDKLPGAYMEVSPSGTGVKVWCRGKLPGGGGRRPIRDGSRSGIEIYDKGRYFCVTGRLWGSAPSDPLPDHQAVIEDLYAWVKTRKPKAGTKAKAKPNPHEVNAGGGRLSKYVAEAIQRECDNLAATSEGNRNHQLNVAAFALGTMADWPEMDQAAAKGALRGAAEAAGLSQPEIDKTIESGWSSGTAKPRARPEPGGKARRAAAEPSPNGEASKGEKPEIEVATDEHRVNDEAVNALAGDPNVFAFGDSLATITERGDPPRGVKQDQPGPTIRPLSEAGLRERLSRAAIFWKTHKVQDSWEPRPVHPPEWCVRAVRDRGAWPGVRPLRGIIEAPTMRLDGSILSQPGYDSATGLFFKPSRQFDPVPEHPTKADATAAALRILELVADFPFEEKTDGAVWLTAVLTVLGSEAFEGRAPLFGIDANTPGTGKGLATTLIGLIATGRPPAAIGFPSGKDADEEVRKVITSAAVRGSRLLSFDNVEGDLGGKSLCRAITEPIWGDRLLGENRDVEIPFRAVFLATGNNLRVRGDAQRRVLFARMRTPLEHPEERTNFRYPDLKKTVTERRGSLVADALLVLRAYIVAGRPNPVAALGSFEDWSRLIPSAVQWASGVNPLDVRRRIIKEDRDAATRTALVHGWAELPNSERGLTAAEALVFLKAPGAEALFAALRFAMAEYSATADLPTAKAVGKKLAEVQDRVIGGKSVRGAVDRKGITTWRVEDA